MADALAADARRVLEYADPATLRPYDRNARTHSEDQVRQIRASIERFGFNAPILLKEDGCTIGAGHGRWMAAMLEPALPEVPVIALGGLTDAEWRAYVIADNKLAMNSGWDEDMLRSEVSALLADVGAPVMGFTEDEIRGLMGEAAPPPVGETEADRKGNLVERFGIAPFSVLNAREGWWQDRKRAWIALGIDSELGRTEDVLFKSQAHLNEIMAQGKRVSPGGSPRPATDYTKSKARGDGAGKAMAERTSIPSGRTFGEIPNYNGASTSMTGTSIFDPVLCELAYRWFSPPGGVVVDPFAGGSVRGIVAGRLGRAYHGIDLRPEQVAANEVQADRIIQAGQPRPQWICADSAEALGDAPKADFLFSCPPYADLEVYSDDPRDLSNMEYADFLASYRSIITKACERLREDRFACFVVGDVRDARGAYRNFVGDTVEAFRTAGLAYYNEAILVTAVGSLPVRTGRAFGGARKLGKTHQNVLVFVKGDPRKATAECGEPEFGDIEDPEPEEHEAPPAPHAFGEPL